MNALSYAIATAPPSALLAVGFIAGLVASVVATSAFLWWIETREGAQA